MTWCQFRQGIDENRFSLRASENSARPGVILAWVGDPMLDSVKWGAVKASSIDFFIDLDGLVPLADGVSVAEKC